MVLHHSCLWNACNLYMSVKFESLRTALFTHYFHAGYLKGALPGLRQYLATESPLNDKKMFLFHLKNSSRFLSRFLELVSLPHFLQFLIFEEKYFSLHTLTDQISLSDYRHFLRYWETGIM